MTLLRCSSRVLASALFFCVTSIAVPDQPVEPRVTLETTGGLCADGAPVPLVPAAGDPSQLRVWGGYCQVAQKNSGMARTSSFSAPPYLRIYMVGATASPTLTLQRVTDGLSVLLVPWDQDLHRWSRCDYALPPDWQGVQVRIVASERTSQGLWRAFSEPLQGSGTVPLGDALKILGLTVLHFIAIMAGALALASAAVLRGVRDTIQAGLIALAGTAVPGYCLFWFSLLAPRASRYAAVCALVATLVVFIFCLVKLDNEGRAILKALITPLLLTGAAALLVLSTGFLYGGMSDPLNEARGRFLPHLPPDNELPYLLAGAARSPHVPSPLFGDWLSSDRPPLQSGIVLANYPLFSRPRTQGYTAVSVLAQSLWIFALWLLLSACRLNSRVVALTLAVCLFSGFVFLNSFYVWPKLLAAAYTLGFFAAFAALPARDGSRMPSWLLPGALLSFGLLSHGGTVFALIPGVPIILFIRRPFQTRRMIAVLLFAFLLYLPWSLYQNFYDPPGNRLLKLHLAGVEPLDSRSLMQTLTDSYGALSLRQIADYKAQNFDMAFAYGFQNLQRTALLVKALVTPGGLPAAAAQAFELRNMAFFFSACCLGFLILGPWALLAGIAPRFRSTEWRAACVFWGITFASMVIWCLLMFGPHTTSVHQGAYATMLLAMAASVLSFWALSPRLALLVGLLQIAVNFLLWGPLSRVVYPNAVLPEGMLHRDTLLLVCCSFAAVLAPLRKLSQREPAV
jgi:hypothetical protein